MVMMDNTWASPLYCKPFELGVDVSIQAGTKYIVGHSDVMIGTACATKEDSWWVAGPYEENPKITTGAGDHFNAGFSAARLGGLSPTAWLTFATANSGYYVRTAQSPSIGQIENFLRQREQDS